MLVRFWRARGRGGKEAREEEKQVQTNRQGLETINLTVGLGKDEMFFVLIIDRTFSSPKN